MNNKPTCHPETTERGQQMRHFYKPIRYEMTATLTHKTSRAWRRLLSTKANKRRERRKAIKQMTYKLNRKMNSKENLDTCRTCGNCKHFTTYRPAWHNGGYGLCKLNKVLNCTDHSCEHHEPADQ